MLEGNKLRGVSGDSIDETSLLENAQVALSVAELYGYKHET